MLWREVFSCEISDQDSPPDWKACHGWYLCKLGSTWVFEDHLCEYQLKRKFISAILEKQSLWNCEEIWILCKEAASPTHRGRFGFDLWQDPSPAVSPCSALRPPWEGVSGHPYPSTLLWCPVCPGHGWRPWAGSSLPSACRSLRPGARQPSL